VAAAYRELSNAFVGFKPRKQQQEMMQRGLRLMTKRRVGVIEAPTGTGKSLGYLIPGIIAAALQDRVLIVSTATASLQDQLSSKDIAAAMDVIRKVKIDDVFISDAKVVVVKGRERYVCPSELMRHEDSVDLFREEVDPEIEPYLTILKAFRTGDWDGTRDTLPIEMPLQQWDSVANKTKKCTGRQCSNFGSCPFYVAQENMKTARVIVTNHDYLLTNLANNPNSPLSNHNAIYVFDEAHHLSDKMIAAFARGLQFSVFWQSNMEALIPSLGEFGPLIDVKQERINGLWRACERSVDAMLGDARQHRFELGEPPVQFLGLIGELTKSIRDLRDEMVNLRDKFKKTEAMAHVGAGQSETVVMFNGVMMDIEVALECLEDFESGREMARWLTRSAIGVELRCSPFDASSLARTKLWPIVKTAVLTSATFASLGDFGPGLRALGLAPDTPTLSLTSPFDYSRATLRVPLSALDGNNPAHPRRVRAFLADAVSSKEHVGILVYFTSRLMMNDCYDALDPELRKEVLLQGDLPPASIVQEHRARIDAGRRSIIFGLDSFGEGIDLPGNYCTRVVVTKLPFPSIDDPITATHAEHLKRKDLNAFHLLTLPAAGLKFAQVCGRLMRREADHGEVMVLDRRLISKTYGSKMVAGTPFRKVSHH
jgi:ATP-dependent DNA helicase DinG